MVSTMLYLHVKKNGNEYVDPVKNLLQLHKSLRTYVGVYVHRYVGVCSKNSRFFATLAQVNQAANGRKKADKVFQSLKQAHTGYDQ